MSGQKRRRFAGTRFSVRSRILASILLVAAIGLTGAGAITFLVQRDRALSQIDERLQSRIESARAIVSKGPAVADAPGAATASTFSSSKLALYGVLEQLIPDRNESALGIYQGDPTYTPGVQTDFHLEDDPAFVARVTRDVADGSVRLGTAVTSVGRLRYIATPVTVAGGDAGAIYVTAVDLDARLEEVTESFRTYELVASAALVAIGLVGWFVAGRLLRPIRRLSVAASRITASDRHERIPVVGRDDVSLLTETVNSMLDRLDAALTGQRQLLDDVRHELKTPITIVRGHLELLDATDPIEVEATRVLALDELDRMTGLVDDIESLAESQRIAPVLRSTDVADLTEEVFAKASGIAGHAWVLGSVAQVSVSLDPSRITQAWLQLIDNASKYSPEGSRVEIGSTEIGVTAADAAIEFWVADEGSGIPAGAEGRIFERFGRVDAGRGIRGSGLGLPIVKAIATAHGGTVSLVSSAAGSRFGIVVPINGGPHNAASTTVNDEDEEVVQP